MTDFKSKKALLFSWYYIIATWFYSGKMKAAPGTFGSLASYPLYFFMAAGSSSTKEAFVSLHITNAILFILGLLSIRALNKRIGVSDWKFIVIDEVVGMFTALSINIMHKSRLALFINDVFNLDLSAYNIYFLLNFIIFRYFDIRKPLFIRSIDRISNNALCIMLDDVLAGLYTAGIVFTLNYLIMKFGY